MTVGSLSSIGLLQDEEAAFEGWLLGHMSGGMTGGAPVISGTLMDRARAAANIGHPGRLLRKQNWAALNATESLGEPDIEGRLANIIFSEFAGGINLETENEEANGMGGVRTGRGHGGVGPGLGAPAPQSRFEAISRAVFPYRWNRLKGVTRLQAARAALGLAPASGLQLTAQLAVRNAAVGMVISPLIAEAGMAGRMAQAAIAGAMIGGPWGAAISAAMQPVMELVGELSTKVKNYGWTGFQAVKESRGKEYAHEILQNTTGFRGLVLGAMNFKQQYDAVTEAMWNATKSAVAGEGFDRIALEWNHAIYAARNDDTPQVKRYNKIERDRWDAQLNRGGNFYGGWGKQPETIGG